MCNGIEIGGLNMIDMFALQKSFIINWITKLLNEESENWKIIPLRYLKPVGEKSVFSSNVTTKDFKGFQLIHNIFWEEAVKLWLDVKGVVTSNIVQQNDIIMNNTNIRFKRNTLFIPNLIARKIVYVKDLYINYELMTFREFRLVHGIYYNGMEMQYNIISNALRKISVSFTNDVKKIKTLCLLWNLTENTCIKCF